MLARRTVAASFVAMSALLALAVVGTGQVHGQDGGGDAQVFRNVKLLTHVKDKKEMRAVMKEQAKALGVKCTHCHVKGDYASDEIPEKAVAREMMRMVERINGELFTWEEAPRATCFMCHRGDLEPRMQPQEPESG